MRSLYAIYRKEMGHYFVSPIAYAIIGLFVLIAAILFVANLRFEMNQAMQAQYQSMQYGMPSQVDVPTNVMRGFFGQKHCAVEAARQQNCGGHI